MQRGGERLQPQVRLERVAPDGTVGLGIAVRTLNREVHLPFDVAIDSGELGGPSAGLMIALTVYDLADEVDLTRGQTIAGTGTIDPTGQIGPVEGVAQKVAAAIDAGADVFLAPSGLTAAARDAADGALKVIEVRTLDQAIQALRDHGA